MSENKPVGLHEEGVEVPYDQLEAETLQNLIQSLSPEMATIGAMSTGRW